MRRPAETGRAVVVKIGTSSLMKTGGGIDLDRVANTVSQLVEAKNAGYKPVLVSSGAVAAGLPALGLTARPTDVPGLQTAAAVGQGLLMQHYASSFAEHGMVAGQVLLTRNVFADRAQYLNARGAIERMLALDVVPVVNENDTVTVDELRFGDNDRLAALVGHIAHADFLVMLTDTAGLYAEDPRLNSAAALLSAVQHNDQILDQLDVASSKGTFGSGGVATKIAAARMAAWSGIPTVIAEAIAPDVVMQALRGEDVGTWIAPNQSGYSARKLWIAFGVPRTGTITIDDGAVGAVVDGGKSLLAVGVTSVDGDFDAGDVVAVEDGEGAMVAKGLVRMSSASLTEAVGQHTSVVGGQVIHRDDLVVLRSANDN